LEAQKQDELQGLQRQPSSCSLGEERADSENFDEIPAHQDRVICLDSHQAEEWALCHLENYNKSSHL